MAPVTAIFLLLILILPVSATEIPKGAHLLLRMDNSINTRTAREGDYVYLRTESPVVAGGQIIVPNGSYVQGVVSRAKPRSRRGARGRRTLRIRFRFRLHWKYLPICALSWQSRSAKSSSTRF